MPTFPFVPFKIEINREETLILTATRDTVPSVPLAAFVNLKDLLPQLLRRVLEVWRIPNALPQMQGASLPSAQFARASRLFNGAAITDEQRPRKMTRREKLGETMVKITAKDSNRRGRKSEGAGRLTKVKNVAEKKRGKAPGKDFRKAGVSFYSARHGCPLSPTVPS